MEKEIEILKSLIYHYDHYSKRNFEQFNAPRYTKYNVNFDYENTAWSPESFESNFNTDLINIPSKMLGLNTSLKGKPYLNVVAGGDWESPVLVVIYVHEGVVCGYVPEGVPYNREKMSAFGNHYYCEPDPDEFHTFRFDVDLIKQDTEEYLGSLKPFTEREKFLKDFEIECDETDGNPDISKLLKIYNIKFSDEI